MLLKDLGMRDDSICEERTSLEMNALKTVLLPLIIRGLH